MSLEVGARGAEDQRRVEPEQAREDGDGGSPSATAGEEGRQLECTRKRPGAALSAPGRGSWAPGLGIRAPRRNERPQACGRKV